MTVNYQLFSDRIELTINDALLFVRRVKRAKLKEFIEHYDHVLYLILKSNLQYGELFIEDANYQAFIDLFKMLPVDGKDTGLEFTLIEEEYEFLNKFLVSASWNEEDYGFTDRNKDDDAKYPLLCQFLRIGYTERVGKIQEKILQETKETPKRQSKTKAEN